MNRQLREIWGTKDERKLAWLAQDLQNGSPEALRTVRRLGSKKLVMLDEIMDSGWAPPFRALAIGGRRWTDYYGNTYHVTTIYFDGELVYESPITYGYGNHYVQTAGEWLAGQGYMPKASPSGWSASVWLWFRDTLGVDYWASAADVRRKRDLK